MTHIPFNHFLDFGYLLAKTNLSTLNEYRQELAFYMMDLSADGYISGKDIYQWIELMESEQGIPDDLKEEVLVLKKLFLKRMHENPRKAPFSKPEYLEIIGKGREPALITIMRNNLGL